MRLRGTGNNVGVGVHILRTLRFHCWAVSGHGFQRPHFGEPEARVPRCSPTFDLALRSILLCLALPVQPRRTSGRRSCPLPLSRFTPERDRDAGGAGSGGISHLAAAILLRRTARHIPSGPRGSVPGSPGRRRRGHRIHWPLGYTTRTLSRQRRPPRFPTRPLHSAPLRPCAASSSFPAPLGRRSTFSVRLWTSAFSRPGVCDVTEPRGVIGGNAPARFRRPPWLRCSSLCSASYRSRPLRCR